MIHRKYLILAAIAGFIVTLDQLTKMYIHTHFLYGEPLTVIQGFFDLTYVRNEGAAFGILRDSQETFRTIFFLSMPPVAMVVILFILKSTPDKELAQVLALSSVFGGAVGNYIDRVRFGYVIDFLDFHIDRRFTWPAFNVADIAIVTGVGVVLLLMVLEVVREAQEKKAQKLQPKS